MKKTNPFGSGDDKDDKKKGKSKKKQGTDQNILEVFKKFSEANKKDKHKPHSVEKQQ